MAPPLVQQMPIFFTINMVILAGFRRDFMASQLYQIDEKEQKTRKRWLKAAFSYFVFYPMALVTLLGGFSGEIRTAPSSFGTSILVVSLFSLIPFWILWHCAYVKNGTAWLTWCLIISPLQICMSFKDGENAIQVLILLLNVFLFAWWYICSIKLRRINKKICIQKTQKKLHPEYLQLVEVLKASSSVEELDALFHKAVEAWPQFESVSSKEYKLKKSELLQRG